jgi:hypothetical protein
MLLLQQMRSQDEQVKEQVKALQAEIDKLKIENAEFRNQSVVQTRDSRSPHDRAKSIPKVDINDLQSTFTTFLVHCKVLNFTSDADVFDAALIALPKTVISSFFGQYRENSTLENLKRYIYESCQVSYPCHMLPSLCEEVNTYFDAENVCHKAMNCPPDELKKHFLVHSTPKHIRPEVRKLCHLPLNEFIRRLTHLLSTAGNAPHRSHVGRFNAAASTSNAHSRPRNDGDRARYHLCPKHQRYGTNAYSCEGPHCVMHSYPRPQPRNPGNAAQRD